MTVRMARRKQPPSPEALRRSGYGAHQSYIDTSVLRQIQAAMDHKRTLYGHSVQDTHGLFETIDTDHSGGLSELEVEKAFRRLDLGLSDRQISEMTKSHQIAVRSQSSSSFTSSHFFFKSLSSTRTIL